MHCPLTAHCDDTLPDDALPPDNALPPDEALCLRDDTLPVERLGMTSKGAGVL